MSSSTPMYDVFLSYRGEDIPRTLVSHLYRSLENKGIVTFRDGMVIISDSPLRVIRESKTAIVVISENYASSAWCLDELAEIIQLQHEGSLMVLPVFYGVNPRDVRRQRGDFGKQFRKILSRYPDKLQKWTYALTMLSNISGFTDCDRNCDDAELIDIITNAVSGILRAYDSCGTVGMDLHMASMSKLLALELKIHEVREIGVFGRGGIGKTTLAKYVYREISHYFDLHLLLEDVNKISQELLQSRLIQASPSKHTISHDGIADLTGKRVLLVADSVDTIEQINILRQNSKLFGPGSRVIVICEDKHLLLACGIKHFYKVKPMEFSEALKLFSTHAFKKFHPPKGFEKLSERVVKLADGVPIVIASIGTELFGKSSEDWEMLLSRYERSYDVFVSFCEEDTRRTFVSHLYRSFVEKGIHIFRDETEMNPDLSSIHLGAIGRSEIALIAISKNYAYSRWCLEELVEILKLSRKGSLMVFPVYYGLDPNKISLLPQEFGKQFPGETPDKVQSWSEALAELGNFADENSNKWEDEAELIQKITDDIWDKLSVSRSNSLVGMHLHMDSMSELLSLESELKEVREIGIYGSVGTGKTTLARYLYQQISHHFNTLLFLENVGRIFEDHGSSLLQEELLWEHIQRSSKEGLNVTKESLRNSKVLLVVDGVDDYEQIKGIQKVATWFGEMSRVIFTCSDKSLLLARGIEDVYHVEPMRFSETLRLFCIHAFKQIRPPIGYEELSDRAVNLADGIPLVTAAVGSELFGRPKEEWKTILSRYERSRYTEGIPTVCKEEGSSGVVDTSKVSGRSLKRWKTVLSKYEQTSDKGTVWKEEGSSGVFDVSKISGRSLEEWKMVLSKYEQSSDERIIGTKISSFGVIDDNEKSLTWNRTTFNYVGMDCHIQAVCGELMELESDKRTRVVGIWGVGGVGKTTLARCVYEEIMPHFHTHVFLENVGKIYQDHRSSRLHEGLLLENMQRSSKNGSDVTKARLRNRKVLLIVDGVDANEQVEDVKKVVTWFGAGSRVILTTRDENLLADNGVEHVYELQCLKVHEALQLFYQFAFKEQAPSTHFKQLSVRAVQLAGRIPLALEVLASFLRGKDENDWETVLQNLERQQDEDMVEVAETPRDVGVSVEEEKSDGEAS